MMVSIVVCDVVLLCSNVVDELCCEVFGCEFVVVVAWEEVTND